MKALLLALGLILLTATQAFCEIKYVDGYYRQDGTYVSGHYRDTSNDGNPYNNANFLGYNHRRVPYGLYDND